MASPRDRLVVSRSGTPLVYRIYGEAGPTIVCCNGVGVSTVFFEPLAENLAASYQVLLWDYPGHGRSGDPEDPATVNVESLAEDLGEVLDAACVRQAVVMGHSLGTQVSLEFYRRYPQRVVALIPTLGTYGQAVSTFFSLPFLARPLASIAARVLPSGYRTFPALIEPLAIDAHGRSLLENGARLLGIVTRDAPDLAAYFAHLVRIDLRVFAALIGAAQRHDARDLLAQVRVPTLVVGATRDIFVPLKVVQKFASGIPGAELFILEGATHAGLFEQQPGYQARVRRFLRERVFPSQTA